MAKSTTKDTPSKPAKPYPEYPLFAHATGRWAKKIRGKLVYFGKWDDPTGAEEKYQREKEDLHAGRKPRATGEGYTVRQLVNEYLSAQQNKLNAGELRRRTFNDYFAACDQIIVAFGKDRLVTDLAADDFEPLRADLAKRHSPVMLGIVIQRMRQVFKWGYDNGKIPAPIRYGQAFAKPSQRVVRAQRNQRPARMFSPEEIRALLDAATPPMRAMILLGINCGWGNTDLGELPLSALDLDAGRADFPRPKTGVQRRAVLWPETVAALRAYLTKRPKAKAAADAERVFVTKYGTAWVRYHDGKTKGTGALVDNVCRGFSKLKADTGINSGRGFYALRHTFETIAGEAGDQAAVNFIMGHAPDGRDMSAVYREWTGDERETARLRRVTDHVRAWLEPGKKVAKKKQTKKASSK